MSDFLSPEEIFNSKESDKFYKLHDEMNMHVRRLLIDQRGLSAVYECNPIVNLAMQYYLFGRITLNGALLLAYRVLLAKMNNQLRELEKNGSMVLWTTEQPKRTLDDIKPDHVLHMVTVCNDLEIESRNARCKVLDELAAQAQEIGLGY